MTSRAKDLYRDDAFFEKMEELFRGEPRGRLEIVNLESAPQRISDLEKQVAALKRRLA